MKINKEESVVSENIRRHGSLMECVEGRKAPSTQVQLVAAYVDADSRGHCMQVDWLAVALYVLDGQATWRMLGTFGNTSRNQLDFEFWKSFLVNSILSVNVCLQRSCKMKDIVHEKKLKMMSRLRKQFTKIPNGMRNAEISWNAKNIDAYPVVNEHR